MTQLASSTDLIVDGFDSTAVDGALSWASSVIEGYCNRTFGLVTGDVVTITPRAGGGMLPQYPVVQVSLVEGYLPDLVNGGMAWQSMTNYWLVADTGLLYDTTGLPGTTWSGGPTWPWIPGSLRVTYDHGYAVLPNDLKDVCVRLATRYLENPVGMVERRVGDMEARFSGSAGFMFDASDQAVLASYCETGVS